MCQWVARRESRVKTLHKSQKRYMYPAVKKRQRSNDQVDFNYSYTANGNADDPKCENDNSIISNWHFVDISS